MNLRTIVRGVQEAGKIRTFAEDKIGKGLARFEKNILGVSVRLLDENGSVRGGSDKICTIEVKLRRGEVRIKEHGDDFVSAIHTALDRCKAALSREVSRGKHGVAEG